MAVAVAAAAVESLSRGDADSAPGAMHAKRG